MTTIEAPSLLGDSIYSSFFLARYAELHPDEDVEVVVPDARWSMELYGWIPGVKQVRVLEPGEQAHIKIDLDRAFHLCTTKYGGVRPFWHTISESLGVNTDDMRTPPIKLPVCRFPVSSHSPILLVPHSVSCASQDGNGRESNKMLSDQHWIEVYNELTARVLNPLFVGPQGMHVPESVIWWDILRGASFTTMLHVLAGARAMIAVDNGMVRLAALLNVPIFFTKPAFLGPMFIPTWGNHIMHEYGHPASYPVHIFQQQVDHFLQTLP